ncbi:MAG: AAA family ATPase [Sporomusaceae bacterium]|nr:AAA family ATPase [Sporomusaceae bacterium]
MTLSYIDILDLIRKAWERQKAGDSHLALELMEQGMAKTADGYLAYNYGCLLAEMNYWQEAQAKLLYAIENLSLVEYRAKAIEKSKEVAKKIGQINSCVASESFLTSVQVKNLFHKHNHTICLDKGENGEAACVISAPNGYGKTAMLKIIKAFFDGDFSAFARIFFSEAKFSFSDGNVVVIRQENNSDTLYVELLAEDGILLKEQHLKIQRFAQTQNPVNLVSRYVPQFVRTADYFWWDSYRKMTVDFDYICRHHGTELYKTILRELHQPEEWLLQRIMAQHVLFINTERLMRRRNETAPRAVSTFLDSNASYGIAVEEDARLMNDFFYQVMEKVYKMWTAHSANYVKSYLQQFPCEDSLDKSQITRRYRRLIRQKNVLERLEFRFDNLFTMPEFIVNDQTALMALQLFLEQVEEIMKPAMSFAKDVYKLKRLVNARLVGKLFLVSPQYGFQIYDQETQNTIGLRHLSAGEQNQIVLFFELLFNTYRKTLVLIDEPELSLHVAWQRAFLPDLLEIARQKGFYAMIATHSPSIINDRWDLNQDLSVDDENDNN